MVTVSNALIRYKTLDRCFRESEKKYSLNDLVIECSKALAEAEGKNYSGKCRVSLRTIQLDIQHMRDKKNGYGAPIEVYGQKYYRYKSSGFSIETSGTKRKDMDDIKDIISILKQYTSFRGFNNLKSVVNILEEEVAAKSEKRESVISCEPKKNPDGLEYFDTMHDAITGRKVLYIGYHSSRSNNIMSMIFYPMYLKEYKGRWFALGYKDGIRGVYRLPLDRIRDFSYAILPFPEELSFNANEYFKDIIGVTRLTSEVRLIRLLIRNKLAPYFKLNPLHSSQKIVNELENGDIEVSIQIIPNKEFYDILFEFQPNISVIEPRDIGIEANSRVYQLIEQLPDYSKTDNTESIDEESLWNDSFNLFNTPVD